MTRAKLFLFGLVWGFVHFLSLSPCFVHATPRKALDVQPIQEDRHPGACESSGLHRKSAGLSVKLSCGPHVPQSAKANEHCFLSPPGAVGTGCYCRLSLRFCPLLTLCSVLSSNAWLITFEGMKNHGTTQFIRCPGGLRKVGIHHLASRRVWGNTELGSEQESYFRS